MHRRLFFSGLLLAITVAAASTASAGSLIDDVNHEFPPIPTADLRQQAIVTAAETLARLSQPNVAFAAPVSALEKALEVPVIRELGISDVHLAGDGGGLLRIEAAFDRRVDEELFDIPILELEIFKRLKPQVRGRIVILAGITSAAAVASGQDLQLRLLPAFHTVAVEKVTLSDDNDSPALARQLARILLRYAENITGSLARADFVNLKIPTSLASVLDPSTSIHIGSTGGGADLTIEAKPVTLPLRLLGAVALITENQVAAVGELVPMSTTEVPPGPAIEQDFPSLKEAFRRRVEGSFQIPDNLTGPWFAIRKDLIAATVNAVLEQAAACFTLSGELADQQVRQEITFPDFSTIDCSPTRDCSENRACDFTPCHDDRGCGSFDFLCQAAREFENNRCRLEAAGRKLDCERLKFQEKQICEGEKAGEKLLCEAGKEALKQLAQTGKFGILEAGIKANTEALRVCLKSFSLQPDLSVASLQVAADGEVAADVTLKFTPLDIVGHIACQAPFAESRTFRASLRSSEVMVESSIDLAPEGQGVEARFRVQELPLRLEPAPSEFLLSSPNLALACQGLNLIKPFVVGLAPFIPELRGEINQEIPEQQVTLDLAIPEETIGALRVKGKLQQSSTAIFLVGEVEADNP